MPDGNWFFTSLTFLGDFSLILRLAPDLPFCCFPRDSHGHEMGDVRAGMDISSREWGKSCPSSVLDTGCCYAFSLEGLTWAASVLSSCGILIPLFCHLSPILQRCECLCLSFFCLLVHLCPISLPSLSRLPLFRLGPWEECWLRTQETKPEHSGLCF